jgi:hypothetical protein
MFRALQVSAAPPETKAGELSQSMQKPNRTDTYHIRLDRRMLASHSGGRCFFRDVSL